MKLDQVLKLDQPIRCEKWVLTHEKQEGSAGTRDLPAHRTLCNFWPTPFKKKNQQSWFCLCGRSARTEFFFGEVFNCRKKKKRKKKPWCSILHVSGKYVKTLKGPVGSLVSITQETQILFQCMLKLVSEGESTTLTNTPHESYSAPSVEDGAWSLVEGCLRNYIHGCCIRNVSKKNLR